MALSERSGKDVDWLIVVVVVDTGKNHSCTLPAYTNIFPVVTLTFMVQTIENILRPLSISFQTALR